MEYSHIALIFLGLLSLNIGCYKTLDTSDELHCDARELVTCGNNMGFYSWEFCKARTNNVKRIRSVHLDIRYPNRYCRSYGTPKNFGLTEPGDSMWVIRSCFGTFLLCLELDPTSTTEATPSTSLLFIWDRDKSQDDKEETTKGTEISETLQHKSPAAEAAAESNNGKNDSSIDQALRNLENLEIVVKEKEGLDLDTKVLLIAAITTAGLCMICLVATVGCFTISRRSHFNINRREVNDLDPEETTVTSVPGPSDEDENIYNVIPCDEQKTNSDYRTLKPIDYEESVQTTLTSENENHNNELPGDLHVYASAREVSRDTGNTRSISEIDENEYDRLRNTPKVTVTDSKTYDRLSDFIKDSHNFKEENEH